MNQEDADDANLVLVSNAAAVSIKIVKGASEILVSALAVGTMIAGLYF